MKDLLLLENANGVYEIHATLVADHKAKKLAKNSVDPMITAYSIVYGEIFDEILGSPSLLSSWLQQNMTWDDIKENIVSRSGEGLPIEDLGSTKITFEKASVEK